MNLSPLGNAIYSLIRADRDSASAPTIEHCCDEIELALHALIRQELVVHGVLAVRDPID